MDRLLDSPHYGEKWARYWLDLARYADSDGYEKDRSRPWAWRYRHWVIDALNRDLPFDQFTIEQLAGDLLPNRNLDTLVATGFNRNTLTNREGGTDPEQFRDEQVLDRAATLGTVWMGLTVGCAQCHNHKYDPISQKEFYQLTAFFNTQEEVNIQAPLAGELGPYLAARPEYDRKRQALLEEYKIPENAGGLRSETARVRAPSRASTTIGISPTASSRTPWTTRARCCSSTPPSAARCSRTRCSTSSSAPAATSIRKEHCEALKLREVRTKLNELNAKLPPVSYAPVLLENDTPPKTYIHVKGDWREHGAEVQPGTLAVLPPHARRRNRRASALAHWLVSPDNPLTSRVAVNRIWQEIFGRGIVYTSEDFGTQGDRPTHPELLDWLASEFMQRGWSMKQMVRLMVTSSTYRQSSNARPELAAKDPENTLLARQSRLRLPAELIRDEALYAGGLARSAHRRTQREAAAAQGRRRAFLRGLGEVGGEHRAGPLPPRPLHPFPADRAVSAADELRRAVRQPVLHAPRTHRHAAAGAQPDERSGLLRSRAGARLPHHARDQAGGFRDRLNYAYAITLGREASAREAERMGKYFDETSRNLAAKPETVTALFPNQLEGVPQAEAAAWVELSRVLLNLDEFITRD